MDPCSHIGALQGIGKTFKAVASTMAGLRQRGVHARCCECMAASSLRICIRCHSFLCDADARRHSHPALLDISSAIVSCAECGKRYLPSSLPGNPEDMVEVGVSADLYEVVPHVPIKGFANLGNTCYMNSVLSIMMSLEPVRNELLSGTHKREACADCRCMICAMGSLVDCLYGPGHAAPHVFIHTFWLVAPRFAGPEQQDAHDFFICLLQKIHEAYSPDVTDDLACKCLAHRTFFGAQASTISCKRCGLGRTQDEAFATIALECTSSIQSSVDAFLAPEDLKDRLACSACGEETLWTKRVEVRRHPDVLSLHLKRFSYDVVARRVGCRVALPDTLDVSGRTYDVLGFVDHSGSIDRGHYRSYIVANGTWHRIDDEAVTASPAEVPMDGSYVFYYLGRGTARLKGCI